MSDTKNSRFEIRLPLMLAITLALGMLIGQKLPKADHLLQITPGGQKSGQVSKTIQEVLGYIEAHYVDSVNLKEIKEDAISKMLEDLDPHSVYISPEELEHVQEDMNGNFEGIGIEFLVVNDTLQVMTPLAGGPSEAAGILAGDKIVQIGDSVVAGIGIDNKMIFNLLRGEKGSKVELGIRRGNESKLRTFSITRDVIPMNSLEIAYMLDEHTGYMKISRFSARTHEEFMGGLRTLVEDKGMRNLVLDLRGNPGGYLIEAVDMLSQFFPEGKLLVYTEGLRDTRMDYKSSGKARFKIDQIAILIDEGSASASEIVAGAIQDHDRGWVIGRRSFGKGLVQEQFPLRDGGALRLTVSRYFTPSGRSIQRDYSNIKTYAKETDRRFENGELSDSTKVKLSDSTEYFTGMGRVVFGGGGIMPDIFIPLDTSFVNDYYYETRYKVPVFVADWLNGHRNERAKLGKDLDKFLSNFEVSSAMMEDFYSYAEKNGVKRNPTQIARCEEELKHHIKARLAKMLFQEDGLYRYLNSEDPAVEKAWRLLQKEERITRK
jgi:carboxyl-terminal processing protease